MLVKFFTVLILGMSAAQSANAFQLGDHENITRQAVAEFLSCFPQYKDRVVADWLVHSDLDEDQNLVVKELFFSHYYSPNRKLSMFRGTSMDRINDLSPALEQCRADAPQISFDQFDKLGHAIHHFQDMAVPAHVVPVKHSFWDGFENFDFQGDISSQLSCTDIADLVDADMQSILTNTAESTLRAIQGFEVEIVRGEDGATQSANGLSFWEQSPNDDFGNYGSLAFGVTQFDDGTGDHYIDESYFASFKQAQLKLAVRATLRGMVWALKPQ